MKSNEKVFLPVNANIPESWIRFDSHDRCILDFPSKKDSSLYQITIMKADGLMSCTCKGFQYGGICSHVKRLRWILKKMPHDTTLISIEARLLSSDETIRQNYMKIIQALMDKPMTADELEVMFGFEQSDPGFSAHQRVSDLNKMGWIEQTGELRMTRRGRRAAVWMIS